MPADLKTEMESPKGLDLVALSAWLGQANPDLLNLSRPLSASLITGGKSNLTYTVSDGTHEVIVRRPPLGHVLATAHDMSREYHVMDALAQSPVPVPAMYGLCEDPEVLGAPFYVMEKAEGTAFQRASELNELGPVRVRAISERLVDTLVTLHAVDYNHVGLSDFGRPEGYLERQVSRWRKQLEKSRSRELPGLDELANWLSNSVPSAAAGTIVHGDFRLDNALIDSNDQVSAVLDWEMSTLGDPLTDVALMLAYQQLALDTPDGEDAAVTDAPKAAGYLSIDEVTERYARLSGRDVSHLGFHLALAYFKLAVILEGIYLRFSQGQTLGSGFDKIGDGIFGLIEHGLNARTSS